CSHIVATPTSSSPLSLHDALPILPTATFRVLFVFVALSHERRRVVHFGVTEYPHAGVDHAADAGSVSLGPRAAICAARSRRHLRDRKSTRLNSSHQIISYAVFCLK